MTPVQNFDEFITKKSYINLNPLSPQHPYRLLICGPSGKGKTNLAFNLIFNYTHWDKLYVVSKMVDVEDKYIKLKDWVKYIENDLKQQTELSDLQIGYFYHNFNDLPAVDNLDDKLQNLVVIDDMITERNHNKIEDYFVRSRKKNCSVVYLTQSFYQTPKLIRDNCTDFAIFDVSSKRELIEISKSVATRIPYEEFVKIYNECIQKPYGFIYIATRETDLLKWIRCGLDGLYWG